MVDPRKLMKLVATTNAKHGHLTPRQTVFLETLHGDRTPLSRKERRVKRAKAREEMFEVHSPAGQDNPFHVTNLVTFKEKAT